MAFKTNQSINFFVINFKKEFKGRLISIIGYGSFFSKYTNGINDVDIIIVLKNQYGSDLEKMRGIIKKSKLKHFVQVQILYRDKILKEGNFFSINTCGPFFLNILINGKVLFGRNIFKEIKYPDRLFILLSILYKVQQYDYQFRNLYLNLQINHNFLHIVGFINKKLKCLLIDCDFFFQKNILIKDIITKNEIKFFNNSNYKKNFSINDVESYLLKGIKI